MILDNFFGRQFNSLNDVSINPRNGDIYFTDPTYGYVQDFRPPPGMPKQVWRFNEATGAVTLVADGFNMPNGKYPRNRTAGGWKVKGLIVVLLLGISFSPNGSHVYIADSGMTQVLFGSNFTFPSTV